MGMRGLPRAGANVFSVAPATAQAQAHPPAAVQGWLCDAWPAGQSSRQLQSSGRSSSRCFSARVEQ
eukprot:3843536-Alexandrium_andersonii.AAC.1